MDRLQHNLHVGCGANLQTEMTATGVPPTFVIANELDSLSVRVESLQKSVLEEQHILLSTMIEKMNTLPASIGDHIRHNLEITGVVHGVAMNSIVTMYDDPQNWEMKQFVSQEALEQYAQENSLIISTKEKV